MKNFLTIFKMEYGSLFPPTCALLGIMAVIEATLLGWEYSMVERSLAAGFGASFTYIIDKSGIHIVFLTAFASMLAIVVIRFMQNYTPSKSIYALLTLPIEREKVYIAKLYAALLSSLCVVAVQLGILIIANMVYKYVPVRVTNMPGNLDVMYRYERYNATMYLSLINSSFLRLLFPPDAFSFAFSLSAMAGAVCLSLYVPVYVKAGRVWKAVITMAVWLSLLLVTFPLAENKFSSSMLKLIVLIIFPFAVSKAGISMFKSGEATA